MKNQDKVLEVLSESLRQQDQSETLLQHGHLLENLVNGQGLLIKGQNDLVQNIITTNQPLSSLEYTYGRIFDVVKNEALTRPTNPEQKIFGESH